MKTRRLLVNLLSLGVIFYLGGCGNAESPATTEDTAATETEVSTARQSAVKDDVSAKNIVGVAVGSADHTTLVAAVKAAELVDVLSNAGPFTVFAPTNAAFDALPKGTVDDLLKPENKEKLQDILQYHVAVAVYKTENLKDGQILNMVNGSNATIGVKDGKVTINGANVVASVPATNGIIHVIDAVILPPAAK
ncbi:MAG: fasciclin domain-containing protein [Bacteroidetes bacterium]|nr:fasciclin domain-containing protein [Bacteroidota bacterium]